MIFTSRQFSTASAFADNFADNSWEDIILACQTRNVPETWTVASQKTMTINGADYAIDIIGRNHDDYSDGSGKAPLTFQMHDLYGITYNMSSGSGSNAGGWTSSLMRSTHLPAIFALMPTEVQAAIMEVNKKTSAGSSSSTINTTADKLFLLSEVEVQGGATNSVSGEGSRYAYYAEGNTRVKKRGSTATSWWLRSPRASSTGGYCYTTTTGAADRGKGNATHGVAFAFCF